MYNSLINLCTCIYSEPRSPDQIDYEKDKKKNLP